MLEEAWEEMNYYELVVGEIFPANYLKDNYYRLENEY